MLVITTLIYSMAPRIPPSRIDGAVPGRSSGVPWGVPGCPRGVPGVGWGGLRKHRRLFRVSCGSGGSPGVICVAWVGLGNVLGSGHVDMLLVLNLFL